MEEPEDDALYEEVDLYVSRHQNSGLRGEIKESSKKKTSNVANFRESAVAGKYAGEIRIIRNRKTLFCFK